MTLADTIAVAIGAKRSGGWWRTTTAHCHAGGNTRDGLAFRSPDDDPDKLIVHCYSRSCHESLEGRNRARDNLRQAAGLPPWQPLAHSHKATPDGHRRRRTGRRKVPAGGSLLGPKTPSKGAGGAPDSDTATYAAQLWTAAAVSTGQAPAHHPVSRWLADRGLWPPGVPLPEAVRWLPREKMPTGKGVRPDSTAAGALVMAMRRLDAPLADPRKVHLVTIDADGRKAQHWTGGRGDKRTYGADALAYGLLVHEIRGDVATRLHVCEGLADGLRILRYAPDPAVVAVCAGTGYDRIEAGWFASITIHPDADEAGMRAAQQAAQRWANRGYQVQIKKPPPGHDPASAPLTEKAVHGQAG